MHSSSFDFLHCLWNCLYNPDVYCSSYILSSLASLGYTLERKFIKKLGIDNLRLFMSGQNLLTFTGWDGWDLVGEDHTVANLAFGLRGDQ